jgi:uncharacterized membrane protein
MQETPFPFPPAAFTGASRRVAAAALFDWLSQGVAMFGARPFSWMGMGCVYLASLLFAPILGYRFLPLGFLLGFLFLPITLNLWIACNRLADAKADTERPVFLPLRLDGRIWRLSLQGACAFGLVYALSWGTLASLLMGIAQYPPQGSWTGLIGLLLAFVLFLLLAFLLLQAFCLILSFALLLSTLHAMPFLPALAASGMACAKNWRVFALFSVLLIIAWFFVWMSAGLGLAVLIPVFCATLHAAYRDIFIGL